MAYRLGWVLYWTCLAVAGVWVVIFCNVTFWGGVKWGSILDIISTFSIPIILLYGIGRALRYVLSME